MSPEWNEALAAFDREVIVLNALTDEYEEYMEAVTRQIAGRVARLSGELVRPEVTEGEDVVGRWWLSHSSDGGLEVRAWPTAPWGGPPGRFRVGVFLDPKVTSEEAMPDDVAVVASVVRESLGELDGDPGSTVTDDDLDTTDAICIQVATIAIEQDDFVEKTAVTTLAYCNAARDAGDAVEELRAGSPYRWLREVLAGVLSDNVLKSTGTPSGTRTSTKLHAWSKKHASTRYIEVGAPGITKMWFVVHGPEVRLAFHLERKIGKSHAESVCAAGGFYYESFDGYHGGLMLDADAVQVAFDDGDSDGVRKMLLAAWRAHVATSAVDDG